VSADATDDGGTALCWAVRVNRADIVEALLAKKANPNKEEDDGGTPLDVAASVGRVQMVKLLLDHGAHVNHKDEGGHTALLYASFGSTLKNAPEWLARSFFEIEENGDDLMASMGTEHLAVVELLLTAGADVNAQAEDCGLTGLMVAAMGGNVELAKILLAHHVDVATGNGEWNALRFAEQFGSPQEIQTQLQELETEEAKQAYFNWVQFTAPGRQTISKMLRKAGAGKSSSGGLK
jgi:ankyrin repeat protein